jgi:hypothetical protein
METSPPGPRPPAAAERGSGLRLYTGVAQRLLDEYAGRLDPSDVTRAVAAAAEGPVHLGQEVDDEVLASVELIARSNLEALVAYRRRVGRVRR